MTETVEVLLIDDEPIVGKRLKPAIEKIGCNVETFQDPTEAMARAEEKHFDIVVTDIRMDGIDGMQVLKRMLDKNADTKVIMITGYAMMALARKSMAQGAFDFIAKPFRPDDLRAVITRAAEAIGKPLAVQAAPEHNG
ncbi:MAG: response regulator [Desulfobacterales bacterium]|nr:response regulator [Desulfobacterales bacterium]